MRNTDGNGSDIGLNEEEEHNVSNQMLEFLRTTRAVWRYNDVCGVRIRARWLCRLRAGRLVCVRLEQESDCWETLKQRPVWLVTVSFVCAILLLGRTM